MIKVRGGSDSSTTASYAIKNMSRIKLNILKKKKNIWHPLSTKSFAIGTKNYQTRCIVVRTIINLHFSSHLLFDIWDCGSWPIFHVTIHIVCRSGMRGLIVLLRYINCHFFHLPKYETYKTNYLETFSEHSFTCSWSRCGGVFCFGVLG